MHISAPVLYTTWLLLFHHSTVHVLHFVRVTLARSLQDDRKRMFGVSCKLMTKVKPALNNIVSANVYEEIMSFVFLFFVSLLASSKCN